jgi:hypothetical protein
MSNFETIQNKLQQFIKKFYTNELLKGTILFFAIGFLYFLVTLFVEYMLWLSPIARTLLFWVFIIVESALFIKFIIFPLAKLFNLRKGIDFETASKLIGDHFPEVSDKLLNVLQLNQNSRQSDLLIASIEQKSLELQPIPFQLAVNFKSSLKYLKYAAVPVIIILLSVITGKMDWFNDSYERVVNYQTAYEPPAPFQFFVINESLQAIENKDFKLNIKTIGDVIPDNAQIKYSGQTYFLQQNAPGEFQYIFSQPKETISFQLSANDITSKAYDLSVINVPTLVNFDMALDYPSHTKKQDETLKSSGSATIPEGTKVTWSVNTKSTTAVNIYGLDTLQFVNDKEGVFEAKKRLYKSYNYSIATSNINLQDYENLAFSINVVKDAYPELDLKVEKDSIDEQSLYFYGQVNDDYGLSKLQLVYYPIEQEDQKVVELIVISNSNFSEFVSAFPDQLNLKAGVAYELYFEVFDNDALHNYKSVKSLVFSYRKRTKNEEEEKQLKQQGETIRNINKTFEKLQEQDKKLKEFSKTQKEKEALSFNDKKKFEDFLKRQKEQEELMKNFNKKLQENLEEFQKDKDEKDQFKEGLKERLKENEEQLKKDEKLLEELEKLKDKINKEEFTQKLEELAKQNKNKKRSMQQLLELTKRFYVAKKAEKVQKQLEELSKEQDELSKKEDKENTKEAQDKLNKEFKDIQKALDELKKENRKLRKPMKIPRDKLTEESIKKDQKEAKESLDKKEEIEKLEGQEGEQKPQEAQQQKQNAQKKQKSAAKQIKQLSEEMKQAAQSGSGGGGDQMQEDAEMLRQILDNLVLFSFAQEGLMEQFNAIDVNHNQYGKFIVKQNTLKEHFEHVDDSLFSLSLRNPKLSENVNKQITDVYFNIDKALGQLSENRIYQGTSSQQYTITASNELADFLSDTLDNMEAQMNAQPSPGSGDGDPLPDIIMTQEELNKKMEEGVKKSEEGKEGAEGEKEGKKPGDKGQEGGQQGNRQGEGRQGENKGKDGEKGNDGKGEGVEGGKKDGYGEGGNEELNGELYKIYQQQQQLRQALENKIGKDGREGEVGDLIQKMEEVELDLINKGFTNQTLEKMMNLQHQLLKLDKATFIQGQENKRESKTNKNEFNSTPNSQIPTAKQYFNTTEILNRQALPLRERFKKKVQDYFKTKND